MLSEVEKVARLAFENIASHLANLSTIRELLDSSIRDAHSLTQLIDQLEMIGRKQLDVTIQTDIRILINEILHILSSKKAG